MKNLISILVMLLTGFIGQGCSNSMKALNSSGSEVDFAASAISGKPNILMIMLDDAGQADWIDPKIAPNIANFKKQATHFPAFYTSPMCAPTRISMLSGRSHADYSILWVCGSDAIYGIPNSDATIPQSLAKRGYSTDTIGKWHASVKDTKEAAKVFPPAIEYGPDQKFKNYVISQGVVGKGYYDPIINVNGQAVRYKGHQTDIQGNQVVNRLNQLKNAKSKPFYLQYWLNAPHSPHHPHPRMFSGAARVEYEKHLKNLKSSNSSLKRAANKYFADNKPMLYRKLLGQGDQNIGKVLNLIKNTNDPYLKNTIILITSDNGGTDKTRRPGNTYGNFDYRGRSLRGFKTDVFEGGIRQNLLVKMPGQTTPRIDHTPISVMDLFPTYLNLVGSSPTPKESNQFDGQSFSGRLVAPYKTFSRKKSLYWPVKNEHVDVTEGYTKMSFAIRKGRWKLVSEPLDNCQPCLFDFQSGYNNENKANDLSEQYPQLVKELREDYIEWYLDTMQVKATPVAISSGVDRQWEVIPGFKKEGPGEVIRDYDFGAAPLKRHVRLANSIKFDVNRLDFSVSAKITLDKLTNHNQVIAMRKGTWRFQVSPQGYLQVVTKNKNGQASVVQSNVRLTPGLSYDVAFSIYSFKSLNSVVKIFARDHGHDLDDEERLIQVARQETSKGLQSNNNTVYVGADPTTDQVSIYGLVEGLRLYHAPLKRGEMGYGQRWWGNNFD